MNAPKTHRPWATGWKTRCRKFARHIHDNGPAPSEITDYKNRYSRRLVAALTRHFAAGLSLTECPDSECPSVWRMGKVGPFVVAAMQDPAYLANHIASRHIGFGWTIALA